MDIGDPKFPARCGRKMNRVAAAPGAAHKSVESQETMLLRFARFADNSTVSAIGNGAVREDAERLFSCFCVQALLEGAVSNARFGHAEVFLRGADGIRRLRAEPAVCLIVEIAQLNQTFLQAHDVAA